MNCQETSHLLDATAPEALTVTQCEAIDRHLASCPGCRADWANWSELVALPVPATPATLRGRILAALPAQRAAPARRAFRPYVVGGVLLVGAGLAAALALQFVQYGREPAAALAAPSVEAVAAAQSAPATMIPDLPADAAAAAADPTRITATGIAMDPHRIVVLKRPEVAADAQAIALADQCHDAMVGLLSASKGMQVITDPAIYKIATVDETTHLPERDRRIARNLGAGGVVVITTSIGCRVSLFNSQTGDMVSGGGGVDPQGERLHSFTTGIATTIRDRVLMDRGTEIAAARTALLNATLDDSGRAHALQKFVTENGRYRRQPLPDSISGEVIATMVYLGTKSPDADVRARAWLTSRDVATDDAGLVQALKQSLASDPADEVRYQAAFALHFHLEKPGVLAALQRAATEDASREPQAGCCVLTVREAAQRASVADRDFRAWSRGILFDTSLPARARLMPVLDSTPDGRYAMLSEAESDREAARVVFDIGTRERDPMVRQMAWRTLRMAAPEEAFQQVLLGDLATHPDGYVRAAAAGVLMRYMDNPDVRRAFERAQDDQEMGVRRVAIEALERTGK